MLRYLTLGLRWIGAWAFYVALIVFAGALLGVLTHVLFVFCFFENPDYGYYAAFGFLNGAKFGGVWAGGTAIVLCVIRACRMRRADAADPAAGD